MPCIVTIGNFDGVHIGHQAVLKSALEYAKKKALSCIAVTFHPHPRTYFQKKTGLKVDLLLTSEEKKRALLEAGMDKVMELIFDETLAGTSAEDFFLGFLVQKLGCQGIVVGEDFVFGKNRQGSVDYLRDICQKAGLFLYAEPCVKLGDEKVSSSAIRGFLVQKKMQQAKEFLGKPFFYEKKWEKKDLLSPFMLLPTKLVLPEGEYITQTRLDGNLYKSMTQVKALGVETRLLEGFLKGPVEQIRVEFIEEKKAFK